MQSSRQKKKFSQQKKRHHEHVKAKVAKAVAKGDEDKGKAQPVVPNSKNQQSNPPSISSKAKVGEKMCGR